MIADAVRLENDGPDYTLIVEDEFGTHSFAVDPDDVLDAVEGYRQHIAEGESVRQEYEASGGLSWDAYIASQRGNEDWAELARESADVQRKAERESWPSFTTTFPRPIMHNDPGDENDRAA